MSLFSCPNEIILNIALSLPLQSICRLSQVCHIFNIIFCDDNSWVWQLKFEKDYEKIKSNNYRSLYRFFITEKICSVGEYYISNLIKGNFPKNDDYNPSYGIFFYIKEVTNIEVLLSKELQPHIELSTLDKISNAYNSNNQSFIKFNYINNFNVWQPNVIEMTLYDIFQDYIKESIITRFTLPKENCWCTMIDNVSSYTKEIQKLCKENNVKCHNKLPENAWNIIFKPLKYYPNIHLLERVLDKLIAHGVVFRNIYGDPITF